MGTSDQRDHQPIPEASCITSARLPRHALLLVLMMLLLLPLLVALWQAYGTNAQTTGSKDTDVGSHPSHSNEDFLADESLGLGTDYELVHPVEVDADGSVLDPSSGRQKRSLGTSGGEVLLRYRLLGSGQDLSLELEPSPWLLAPGFTVTVLGDGSSSSSSSSGAAVRRVDVSPAQRSCHYQGRLRGMEGSSVAVSTCDGLSGLIRTSTGEYFISPLPDHLARKHNISRPAAAAAAPPHVLYRRAAERRMSATGRRRAGGGPRDGGDDGGDGRKRHYCGEARKKSSPSMSPSLDPAFRVRPDEYPRPTTAAAAAAAGRQRRGARSRRSPARSGGGGKELTVETLVVADKRMLQRHTADNVTTYILTVLNMVSTLFKDGTIGSKINMVVVGLILLEEDQPGLVISHHADQTLSSFCQWQAGVSGRNGARHDHAILLTGLDICSWQNKPCDTLGFAPISGMCSKYRSCTVNEDSGLGVAFTIAHESGHNFGMIHDGEGNACKKTEGSIMSPTLAGNNGVFTWSDCSRQYLHRFLNSPQAACLADKPKTSVPFRFPEELPGQLYDGDTQCRWLFGTVARMCSEGKRDVCKALWCHRDGRHCETKFLPAAEGTACGSNMWCRRGECVRHGEEGPRAVPGNWAPWAGWSECSRTCGGGVTRRERVCSDPRPAYGGGYCEGPGRMYRMCNVDACPTSSPAFRAQQCAEYNSKPFRGWLYKWKPYTKVDEQDICKLYCMAEDFDFFFALASKVKDGTPCAEGSTDICVDGVCEEVGCDQTLGSGAALDACGVCNGDNSSCQVFRGHYTAQHHADEYHTVVVVPPGARWIRVFELSISSSLLAVRTASSRHQGPPASSTSSSSSGYYLNGARIATWPGRLRFAGVTFDYKRPYNRPESLSSPGPTNQTLVFEVLIQGRNPGIGWEYTLPKDSDGPGTAGKPSGRKHSHAWALSRSECSATCGGGQLQTRGVCLRDRRTQVNGSFCDARQKPATTTHTCNHNPCPASWSAGEWSACSVKCGGGQQTRAVACVRAGASGTLPADDSACPAPAPAKTRACNPQDCPPAWVMGSWSQCSKPCGRGVRTRAVQCRSSGRGGRSLPLADERCDARGKPAHREFCMLRRCRREPHLQWLISAWSECSATCGPGVQRRSVSCGERDAGGALRESPSRRCRQLPKPPASTERPCRLASCPAAPPPPPRPPPRPPAALPRALPRPAERQKLAAPLGASADKAVTSNAIPQWDSATWSQCTVSCGGGVQTRAVRCASQGHPAHGCLPHLRPPMSAACNTHFCPHDASLPNTAEDSGCRDQFGWCSLVPQHGMCSHSFYGRQCCRSCAGANNHLHR
ncbi:A disintegrin and metalloproteinase with thrombospondin motifs 18-like [Petromyzon marinus]|uniref:A disintegrin and metalloproteinase with thrombospondin motifs 18-like n=1 Tax=Petromyzon marinus TaxID=7757 RepID=UPI003F71F718